MKENSERDEDYKNIEKLETVYTQIENTKFNFPYNKKKRIIRLVYFLIIFLFILFLIIFLIFFLKKKNQNNTKNKCETGEEEKCWICHEKKNICISCNIGYKLVNGKCILNYSFKAIYFAEKGKESIQIMNSQINKVIKMKIDNEIVKPCLDYTFNSSGIHEVYILINLTDIKSLNKMFNGINKIISISFTKEFNTEIITDMAYMFNNCNSLTSINISFFNTINVEDMNHMFYNCNSLII